MCFTPRRACAASRVLSRRQAPGIGDADEGWTRRNRISHFGSHGNEKVDFPYCLYIRGKFAKLFWKMFCVMTSALKIGGGAWFNESEKIAVLHGDDALGVLKKLDDFVRLVDAELDAATEGDAGGVVPAEE